MPDAQIQSAAYNAQDPTTKGVDYDDEPEDTKTIAGYGVGDILKAPIEVPSPEVNETKKDTSNHKVRFLVMVGVILFLSGVVFILLLNAVFGFIVLLIGAGAVVTSVFAPVK